MSRNINGIPVIAEEPELLCFECGKIAETRPYGKNGEELCYACAMKDKLTTETMMAIKLFGDPPDVAKVNAKIALTHAEHPCNTKLEGAVIHVLWSGRSLCGFSDKTPNYWPVGNYWVSVQSSQDPNILRITCALCAAKISADLRLA